MLALVLLQLDLEGVLREGDLVAASLLAVASFLLSMLVYFIPSFRRWHESLSDGWKPGFFALAMLVCAIGMGVLSFANVVALVTADLHGIAVLIVAWVISLATTQGTYSTLIRPRKNGS